MDPDVRALASAAGITVPDADQLEVGLRHAILVASIERIQAEGLDDIDPTPFAPEDHAIIIALAASTVRGDKQYRRQAMGRQ